MNADKRESEKLSCDFLSVSDLIRVHLREFAAKLFRFVSWLNHETAHARNAARDLVGRTRLLQLITRDRVHADA